MDASQKSKALELLAQGLTVTEVTTQLAVPRTRFYAEKDADPEFAQGVENAIEAGADVLADQLVTLGADAGDRLAVDKAKLKSDNLKWLLERRARKTFGPKVDVNLGISVDVKANLEKARAAVAALPPRGGSPALPKSGDDAGED